MARTRRAEPVPPAGDPLGAHRGEEPGADGARVTGTTALLPPGVASRSGGPRRADAGPESTGAWSAFARRYLARLEDDLQGAPRRDDGVQAARLARRARTLGIDTLTLARIHDRAFASMTRPAGCEPPRPRAPRSVRVHGSAAPLPAQHADGHPARRRRGAAAARAAAFFARVSAPEGPSLAVPVAAAGGTDVHATAGATTAPSRVFGALRRSAVRLGEARDRLRHEVRRRRDVQSELERSERTTIALGERSRSMQARLRRLSHRLLGAQEDERSRISRDLRDAIGQTLAGINVGLATLQHDAVADSKELAESIATTQALVERSMKSVHEFARELRPTVLDDLGLVSALRSHARAFSERTGIRVRFSSVSGAARLGTARRVALFRVAQEALMNVARHSGAREVCVALRRLPRALRLEVRDDGRSFDVERVGRSRKNQHLGLLGMQERMDMVGGKFSVASAAGVGTTVRADVPLSGEARG